jgi:SPP1 gp7 family putative phage head morphogenesis protein
VTAAAVLAARRRLVAAAGARRRPKRIGPLPPPAGALLSYTRELLSLSRAMDAVIIATLARAGLVVRNDADGSPGGGQPDHPELTPTEVKRIVAGLRRRLGAMASRQSMVGAIDRAGALVTAYNREGWRRQLQRAMGIDLQADPNYGPVMDAWRKRNVVLIQSLAMDKVARVHAVLRESGALRVEQIQRRIADETGATQSRAALIARDQVLKLHSEVTEVQHRAAGITRFEWSTSGDERVRKSHRELEGKQFDYAHPPVVDGEKSLPGRVFQCRCVAVPLIEGVDY